MGMVFVTAMLSRSSEERREELVLALAELEEQRVRSQARFVSQQERFLALQGRAKQLHVQAVAFYRNPEHCQLRLEQAFPRHVVPTEVGHFPLL